MLEQKIEALTRAVEALTQAITSGAVKATEPAQTPKPDPQSHTPAVAFSDQSLKDVTLAKSREGYRDAIRNKLNDMGVKKLQDLAQDQAAEFYQWVIGLGNN